MFRFKKYGITPLSIMLIVSSLLFGFSHFYNYNGSFIATIPYGLAGLVLAISYLLTNKFFVPTIAHIIFNSTSLISSIFLLIVYLIK
ncbi:CPBP family intramembrane metalloprotease [Lactobacillus sp. S2-2]|nr:CPBP family intramembrane metalloprotease [Lactobacillus sp. S2-2]